jgi:hypothetical protein
MGPLWVSAPGPGKEDCQVVSCITAATVAPRLLFSNIAGEKRYVKLNQINRRCRVPGRRRFGHRGL